NTAALARKAADAKVDFERARRAWLDRLASSSLYAVYAAQAKLELERAKVAQANNLVAAGFDLAAYEKQLDDRTHAAQDAAASADREHAAAEAKLAAWSDAEHAFIQASGFKGPAESDRATSDWKLASKPVELPKPEPAKPAEKPAEKPPAKPAAAAAATPHEPLATPKQ